MLSLVKQVPKVPFKLGRIDSDRFASKLRKSLVDVGERKVLLARISGSLQARDRYTLTNSGGMGRVREFSNFSMHLSKARSFDGRPVPLLRGHPTDSTVRSQVFQLAGCNWRCWYCYVDDVLLEGKASSGSYLSAAEMVEAYLLLPNRPLAIDLSGGQPDLIPEWTLWVLEEIDRRGLRGSVLVWQDDNLSSEMLWDVLTGEQIDYMARFEGHSRVGCLKGFDDLSFSYNTLAPPHMYERQFSLLARLLRHGFNVYAYATFTAPPGHCTRARMSQFVDKLQEIHPLLPLRTIPLQIRAFSATAARTTADHEASLTEQLRAGEFWDQILAERFSMRQLQCPYEEVAVHTL